MAPRIGSVSTQASQNEPIETYSFLSGPTISERVWWFGLPGMSAPAGSGMISWACTRIVPRVEALDAVALGDVEGVAGEGEPVGDGEPGQQRGHFFGEAVAVAVRQLEDAPLPLLRGDHLAGWRLGDDPQRSRQRREDRDREAVAHPERRVKVALA